MNANEQAVEQSRAPRSRKRTLLAVTLVFLLAGIAWGAWWMLVGRHMENTDDAYVSGNVVQVTPQVAGTVVAIHADDTDQVKEGMTLVELDRSDAELALHQAQAQLAQTVREVRTLYVNNNALSATVAARAADVARARSDLERRQQLAGTGAVSAEDIAHAKTLLQTAESALAAAREQLASNRVLTERITIEKHPSVQRAAAQLRNAYLAWTRTAMPAPVSGMVAKRVVQVGQRVSPGTPLMSIVPLDAVWVDGNFKEVQEARMRIGQPVTLQADVYGSKVTYHGRVAGLSAGTGAAFALLPTQNASGNWIKVVQRLPVRIALDAGELAKNPLRVGLSMRAEVDVSDQGQAPLAAARKEPAYSTRVFEAAGRDADAMVSRIIRDNAGKGQDSAQDQAEDAASEPAGAKAPGKPRSSAPRQSGGRG